MALGRGNIEHCGQNDDAGVDTHTHTHNTRTRAAGTAHVATHRQSITSPLHHFVSAPLRGGVWGIPPK